MTKKIDTALKDLVKALEKHAQIVGLKPVPLKKAGRAAAELRVAATAYANLVESKTGQRNPFIDFLDPATMDSLQHERDLLAQRAGKEAQDAVVGSDDKAAEKASDKAAAKGAAKRAAAEADAEKAVDRAGAEAIAE